MAAPAKKRVAHVHASKSLDPCSTCGVDESQATGYIDLCKSGVLTPAAAFQCRLSGCLKARGKEHIGGEAGVGCC